MADIEGWLRRIEAVEARLLVQADRAGGRTGPDARTGETWERGQVWGHLAEFMAFWIEQAGDVIDEYQGEPIAYGRMLDDPARGAGIESGLQVPIETLWPEVRSDLVELRKFISALPENWTSAVGRHPTRGEVRAEDIIEQTLVGHLEEHADQLESI